MHIETNLAKIKHFASIKEDDNFRFRSLLKSKDEDTVDRIVHQLHDEFVKQIDCSLCGNCCIELKPRIHNADLALLAQLENINPEDYLSNYCEKEDGEIFLKTMPCRYLNGKSCSIYESRPKECCRFPYTNEKGFIFRLYNMLSFYAICPIVFNLMERLKYRFHFH